MTYLITGGTGFIGAYVARTLLQRGEKVVAYDTLPQEESVSRVVADDLRDGMSIVTGNILDLARLIDTAQRHEVDKVVHLAYLLAPDSSDNPLMAVRVNCEGTVNVFETARLLGLKRVVWTSSAGVFGPPERYRESVLPNDAAHFPIYIYGACKSLNETVAQHYFNKYGLDTIGVRVTFVYGPSIRRGGGAGLVASLIDKPAVGIPSVVPFGDDTMNLQHVEETARMLVMASDAPQTATRVFNTTGEVVQVKEAVAFVKELLPDAAITAEPGFYMGGGVIPRYDTSLLEQEIGFKPAYGLKEGLRRSISQVRSWHGLSPV
jgi:UDP-glucose 4-epimerase